MQPNLMNQVLTKDLRTLIFSLSKKKIRSLDLFLVRGTI